MRRRFMNISRINIDNYLTIEALEDGLTVSLEGNMFEYCIDGDGHWKKVIGVETESIDTGHMLSIRGEAHEISKPLGIGTFKISKKCNLKGNCLSILFKDNAANNYRLEYSLAMLFYRCEGIVEVSENFLPATTLAEYCYNQMFRGCTSLTTAPELPATTLVDDCYYGMFDGCSSLTTAPELPATKLASNCYSSMFYGCSSLTTAPALPATTLVTNCYRYMFNNCSKLNYIKAMFTTTPSSSYTDYWVSGVASSGTFVKSKDATWNVRGTSGIPSGWTVQTA